MDKKITDRVRVKDEWSDYWRRYHGVTKIGGWFQKRALTEAFSLVRKAGIRKKARVIDVGCGEGRTLQAFRENGFSNSIGIDNTKQSLEHCQTRGFKVGKDVFLKDLSKNGYKNGEFDLAFSEGLLEHFNDPTDLLKEIARISEEFVLLIQPNHHSSFGLAIAVLGNLIRNNVREYSFGEDYFIKRFKENGFALQAKSRTILGEYFILLFKKACKKVSPRLYTARGLKKL